MYLDRYLTDLSNVMQIDMYPYSTIFSFIRIKYNFRGDREVNDTMTMIITVF